MKKSYAVVNKLKPTESAYVAGIIDGEGTVTLSVKQKGGTRHLAVTMSGTELSLIKYLPRVIGAGRVTNKKVYKLNHAQAYTYSIYSRQAIDLLIQVLPYLQTYKAKRAKFALEQYIAVTPRNGRYTSEQKIAKDKFVEIFSLLCQNKLKTISLEIVFNLFSGDVGNRIRVRELKSP